MISKRLRISAKQPHPLAFEALEPRALLTTVADWWGDVGQWTTPDWWSDDTWWDDTAWGGDSVATDWAVADWVTEEPSGLEAEAEAEVIADVPEAGIPDADALAETPLVAEDAAATSSEGETAFVVDAVETPVPGQSPEHADEPSPIAEKADQPPPVAEEAHKSVDDAFLFLPVANAEEVVPDIEGSPLEADENVVVAEQVESDNVSLTLVFEVDQDLAVPVIPPTFVNSESTAGTAAEPVPAAVNDTSIESDWLEPDEQSDDVATQATASAEPIFSVTGIPAAPVVGSEPSLSAESGTPTDATAGRLRSFWAGLLAPGGLFGLGGAALEPGSGGESGVGSSGFMTVPPVAGRQRNRLPFRRLG